jgi:hypothetical protein
MSMRAIISAVLLSLLAGAAVAQNAVDTVRPQSQPPDRGVRQEAPVGHRQPTERSLPPGVRKNEDTVGEGRGVEDPFGPLPNICRGC